MNNLIGFMLKIVVHSNNSVLLKLDPSNRYIIHISSSTTAGESNFTQLNFTSMKSSKYLYNILL